MSEPGGPRPFFLIVTGEDRGVFSVEGPMSDDAPGAPPPVTPDRQQRHVTCGPTGPDLPTDTGLHDEAKADAIHCLVVAEGQRELARLELTLPQHLLARVVGSSRQNRAGTEPIWKMKCLEWLYKRLADLARPEPLVIERAGEARGAALRPITPAEGWPR